jgi:hypothetical protein
MALHGIVLYGGLWSVAWCSMLWRGMVYGMVMYLNIILWYSMVECDTVYSIV